MTDSYGWFVPAWILDAVSADDRGSRPVGEPTRPLTLAGDKRQALSRPLFLVDDCARDDGRLDHALQQRAIERRVLGARVKRRGIDDEGRVRIEADDVRRGAFLQPALRQP